MSAPISRNSPSQGSPSEDIAQFDGAKDLLRAWSRGIRPDPDLTVSEWADRHRWLSSRASAEPGRYRTARTPYMREIMDALSPVSPVQRVVFMKAAQVVATRMRVRYAEFALLPPSRRWTAPARAMVLCHIGFERLDLALD